MNWVRVSQPNRDHWHSSSVLEHEPDLRSIWNLCLYTTHQQMYVFGIKNLWVIFHWCYIGIRVFIFLGIWWGFLTFSLGSIFVYTVMIWLRVNYEMCRTYRDLSIDIHVFMHYYCNFSPTRCIFSLRVATFHLLVVIFSFGTVTLHLLAVSFHLPMLNVVHLTSHTH